MVALDGYRLYDISMRNLTIDDLVEMVALQVD